MTGDWTIPSDHTLFPEVHEEVLAITQWIDARYDTIFQMRVVQYLGHFGPPGNLDPLWKDCNRNNCHVLAWMELPEMLAIEILETLRC